MPVPGPHDLLVRVHAVAVNPVDTKIRASLGTSPQDPPRILGWDAAGIVQAAGPDATGFAQATKSSMPATSPAPAATRNSKPSIPGWSP